MRCWATCVLQLFENQVATSWISHMTKTSWQKLKYLENEKSFYDEIRSIFHHVKWTFNQANNTIFFGRWESDFNELHTYKSLELSSLSLYSNFMSIKLYITVTGITIHTLFTISLFLHIFILVVSILFDAIASPRRAHILCIRG